MGTWEDQQIFEGNLVSTWTLGSNSVVLLREQSKNIYGSKRDFGHFSREHEIKDPVGGSEISNARNNNSNIVEEISNLTTYGYYPKLSRYNQERAEVGGARGRHDLPPVCQNRQLIYSLSAIGHGYFWDI